MHRPRVVRLVGQSVVLRETIVVAIAGRQTGQQGLHGRPRVPDERVPFGDRRGGDRIAPDLEDDLGSQVLPVVDVLELVPVRPIERVVGRSADIVRDGPARPCAAPAARRPRSSRPPGRPRDRREQVADPARLELREQPQDRERRVEVHVHAVVERVVGALEEGEPAGSSGSGVGPPTSPASQKLPPSTRKYSSLKRAALYQSGRSSDSSTGRCQASIAARHVGVSASACPARSKAAHRSGPSRGCSASTSGGPPRTRPSAGPTRSRTGSIAARPAPARRSPRRPHRSPRRPRSAAIVVGSRRPSAAKSAHSSRSGPSNRDRTVMETPGSRDAAMANVPRRPGGASVGAWRIAPPTSS